MLKSVVLPAPLGPIRLVIVPDSRANSTSLTAIKPPKALLTCRASRSAIFVAFLLDLDAQLRRPSGAGKEPLRTQQHDDDQRGTEEEPAPQLQIDALQGG